MKKRICLILSLVLLLALFPTAAVAATYDTLTGRWQSASIDLGSYTLNLQALVLDTPMVDCTQITVNMDVDMKNGTSCSYWKLLGRQNGTFKELGAINLPGGNGRTTQTLRFSTPVSFDAVAIRPSVMGSYSWSMDFTLTNVVTKGSGSSNTTQRKSSDQNDDDIEEGDIVTFGTYEQDNNRSNGPEPIEWIVLSIDEEEESILLVSRYILDCVPYSQTQQDTKWDSSYARSWLNSTFLKTAFTRDQQKYLAQFYTTTPDNPEYGTRGGSRTLDQVTLLSIDEAARFFPSDYDRRCKATAYAAAQGTQVYTDGAWWRLRSPGKFDYSAASVFASGQISYSGDAVSDGGCGLRPVILFSLPD